MTDKKYDWMALLQYQPQYTLSDFKDLGITPENTEFKSKDYYKGLNAVREADIFKNDSGEFDENKFNNFYDQASLLYNGYANEEVYNNLASSYTYDPWEWWNKDGDRIKDVSPKMTLGENPLMITSGVKGLGEVTESPFSTRELAQRNKIYDYTTNTWLDKTPNDYAGIFKSWTAPTLVLATYDQDETEIDENGREIKHKKGDIKLDRNNIPFYETLGDRDASGKDFLLREDIYSVDGGRGNKIDIFDADGKRTSAGKVVAKSIVRVAPYLIPGGVGQIYAYLKAGQAMAEFVPTLLKSVDAFVTNDTTRNDFGRTMNDIVGYMNRFDHGVSDASREKLLTFENVGKMFADVSGQLFEQKAVANITRSKLLKKYPKIANNAALSKALAYGYMSTTSAEEAYDIFKQAGADDRTSALAMWGLIGIYYRLMSADYYKHALFRNSWIDEKNIKEPVRKMTELYQKEIALNPEALSTATPEQAAKTLNWFQRNWEKLLGVSDKLQTAGVVGGKTWLSAALSEGVEEVTEEIGIDTLKGLAKGLEALGFSVSEDELDFGFSGKDVLQRYGTSFLGGAFGGAVFHGYNLMDPAYKNSVKAEMLPETVIGDIVTLVMQNRQGEIYRELDRGFNNKEYGSNDLSATKFNLVRDVGGEVVAFEGANGQMSQNEMVYNEVYKTVKFIENILKSEGFSKAQDAVKKALQIDDETAARMLFTGGSSINFNATNLILDDLKRIGSNIVDKTTKMKAIEDSVRPTDAEGGKEKLAEILKDNLEYQDLVKELDYWRSERDAIYNKENLFKYMLRASVVLDRDVITDLVGFSDIDSYTIANHGKPISQFTPEQQKIIRQEFDEYFRENKVRLFETARVYNALSERFAERLNQKEQELSKIKADDTVRVETVGQEMLQKLSEINRLNNSIEAIQQKTEKTDGDTQRLNELTEEKNKLTLEVNEMVNDPQRLISRAHVGEFDQENLSLFANTLINWYKSLEDKHKYDDSDLNRFIQKVKNTYAVALINRGFDQMIADFREANGLDYVGDTSDSFWAIPGESEIQDRFRRLIKEFYDSLDGSYDDTISKYNEIVALLKEEAGMSDEEIENLLFSELNELQEDGTTLSFGISIIPKLADKTLPEILQQINDSRSKITYSDGNELVRDFLTMIGDNNLLPLLELLEQEEKRITDVGKYVIGNKSYREQLKTLRSIVNTISAIVNGSYDGLNEFLNVYRAKEKLDAYPILSENTAKILHNDLENLKNRINFVLLLDEKNSSLKLREQREVGANMRVKFLQKLTNHVYIKEFEIKFGIDLDQLIKDNASPDFLLSDVTADNFDKYEKDIIAIESALYDAIKTKEISDEDIIDNLIAIYGDDDLYKLQSTKLTKEKEEKITSYDTILYAVTLMTLHSNDFYVLYRNAIQHAKEVDPEFDLVPVFGQEYALRLVYAYTKNKDFFNSLLDKIKATYKGNEKYQLNKRVLYNILSVFGGAGTGKSRGVGAMLMHLFPDAEFRFIGPTDSQVNSLLEIFKQPKDSSNGMTIDDFKEKVIPNVESEIDKDKKTRVKLNYNPKTEQIDAEDYTLSDYDWFGKDEKLRFLIVDEAAMNNSFILKVLSDYAVNNEAMVVALGDPNQTTGKITYNKNGKVVSDPDGYEETVHIKSPYLTANFRSEYISKADNYVELLSLITQVSDKVTNSNVGSTKQDVEDKFDDVLKGRKAKLKYWVTERGVAGDFITSNENYFKGHLDKILETNASVLLITDATTSSKYIDEKYNKPNLTKRSAEQAQGGEFDYVFVDKAIDLNTTGKFAAAKDLYTISQRSRFGSVIYDPDNAYDAFVLQVGDRTSVSPWNMSADQKAEYANWRMSALKDLTPSENYNDNTLIEAPLSENPEEVEKVEEESPADEVKGGNDVTLNPEETGKEKTPEESPVEEPIEEPAEEVTDVKEESETPNNPAIPTVTQPNILLDRKAEGFSEINPTSWDDYEIENPFDDGNVNSLTEVRGTFNSDIFFNRLFTSEFYKEQTKDKSSLFNFLKANNIKLKEREYQDLVFAISKKILNNDYDFHNIIVPNDIVGRLVKNTNPKYVEISIVNGHSVFIAVFNDNKTGEELFRVPITESSTVLKEGILMLDGYTPFIISGKPTYDKSNTKQITLGELKRKYPWLNFTSEAGTVVYTGELDNIPIANDAVFFERRNDGKTFLTVYGIGLPNSEIRSLWQSSIRDGKLWIGTNIDQTSKIGIQRVVKDVDDVILYSVALNYLRTFDEDSKAFLQKRGWNTDTKDVISKLKDITKNDAWDAQILKQKLSSGDSRWKSYFEALRIADRRSAPISWAQNERIMADLFGEMLKNPNNHKNAWLRLHTKFHNLRDRSFGLIFKVDPTHQFVILQDEKIPTKLYIKTYVNGRPGDTITEIQTDGNVEAFRKFIIDGIQNTLSLAGLGISDFNANYLRVSGLNINWKDSYYNQQNSLDVLFNIFNPNDTEQISNYLNHQAFTNGLYGNFSADENALENSVLHRSEYRDDDVTMASEWRGEFITINESDIKSINSENPNQVADIQRDGKYMINNIVETASTFVDKEFLVELRHKYEEILLQSDNITDSELDSLLANMMDEINQNLLNNATSKNVNKLMFDEDHARIIIQSQDSKAMAYANLIRDGYGVELDTLQGDQYPISRVDVIVGEQIDGRQAHYVFYEEEGKLKVLRTLNYDNWKNMISLIDTWRNTIPQEPGSGLDPYQTFRRELNSVRLYFEHLLINSVRNDEAKKYWEVISKYLKDLQEYDNAQNIQSALEQYLISRINDDEC